ncbi:hypothetical protein LEP1GSC064_2976 [Leptospira kirschneri serovar Grippotyphosa str. Moskva]|nr:hypothetical protein LEP1GSC064_2976 [Leptospira kirschneri serovar Grippotyphosa str. Moskva]
MIRLPQIGFFEKIETMSIFFAFYCYDKTRNRVFLKSGSS